MHIEEPANNQLELQISLGCAQQVTVQGQLQKAQALLETCQHSQAALQMALAASGLGWWDWNLTTNTTYYDPPWQGILGYEIEDIDKHYQSFEQLVHQQDLPRMKTALNDYLGGRTPVYEVELRMLTQSGEWKWIVHQGKVSVRDNSGKPVRMVGTYKDISQEKSTQEALRQQVLREQLLVAIQERIHACESLESVLQTAVEEVRQFLQTDRTLIYRFHSDGSGVVAFESVKAGVVSLLDMDISPLISDSDLDDCDSQSQFEIKANLVVPIFVRVREDEESTDCSDKISAIQNPQSPFPESGLGTTQNRLWGLLIVHHCCDLREWEEWEIESLQQLSVKLAIAIKQSQLFEQVKQQNSQRLLAQAREKEKSQQQDIILKELQNVQGQLLQNERMANLGQLVAEMAKEINNPVNLIYANLHPASQYAEDLIRLIELYQYYYPTPSPVIALHTKRLDLDFVKTDFLKLLWSMRSGSERIKEIVLALRNFSRFDEGQLRKFDLHEGLESVLRILQHRLKEQPERGGIEVVKEFGELPSVECYPGELNQVFMNILTNAIDALEERIKQDYSFIPQIRIRTEIVSSHLSLVCNNETRATDKRESKRQKVLIHIYDNGKGILPHVQRHIFEPFFTTKPIGKGKGLGLSMSEQIIEKHQGKIKCHSRLGQGTEFVIEMNIRAKGYANMRKHASF